MKDNKSGWCHNLGPGRILWGSVAATTHVEVRFSFTCNSIFCLLQKKLCSRKNQEQKKVLVKKKKKKEKNRPKEERKSTIL